MRDRIQRHPAWTAVVGLVLVVGVAIVVYAIYLAGSAGRLPWQEDPTRIPITPFADIPGFTLPTKAAATATPAGTPIP